VQQALPLIAMNKSLASISLESIHNSLTVIAFAAFASFYMLAFRLV